MAKAKKETMFVLNLSREEAEYIINLTRNHLSIEHEEGAGEYECRVGIFETLKDAYDGN